MKIIIVIFLFIFAIQNNKAQPVTLDYLINLAKENNHQLKIKNIQFANAILQNNDIVLATKPNLILSGSLPVYDKDNFSVRQPDGSIKFLNRSQVNSNFNIGIQKTIVATGGTISANTSLNRFDNLIGKTKQYSSTPFYFQIQQPLFAFNTIKWQQKIAPLQLAVSALDKQQAFNDMQYDIVVTYMELHQIETEIENNKILLSINELLKKNELKLSAAGHGNKDKQLQLEIALVNAAISAEDLIKKKEQTIRKLSNIIGNELKNISTEINYNLPSYVITPNNFMDSLKKIMPEFKL